MHESAEILERAMEQLLTRIEERRRGQDEHGRKLAENSFESEIDGIISRASGAKLGRTGARDLETLRSIKGHILDYKKHQAGERGATDHALMQRDLARRHH